MSNAPHTSDPAPVGAIPRRDLLRLGLAGGGALAATPLLARVAGDAPDARHVVRQSLAATLDERAPSPPPKVAHFTQRLKVPPVLAPTSTADGVDTYDIVHRPATARILPKPFPPTPIFGYNGIYPGPTIRQTRSGRRTVVRNRNALPAGHPYSTHLHGSPSQPFYDGHPDDLVPVGAVKTYRYPNDEEGRTLWYHDHAIHQTADHVYRGLAGFFLQQPSARETGEFRLAQLPSGEYDVPLLVSDVQYTPEGRVFFDDEGHDSLFGNVVMVNGVAWPFMVVDRAKYRFRILVASVSRGFDFTLSNGMPMVVIATDAGLVRTPVPVQRLRQGMAERYEVVIDFSGLQPGTKVTLLNARADDQMRDVMQFVVGPGTGPARPLPPLLNEPDAVRFPSASAVVRTREFRFDRSGGLWTINGLPWDERVVATPRANTTERWIFQNNSGGWFHPIHVHLVDFLITRRNGGPAFPYENGLKDVAYVGPNERLELLMTFRPAPRVDPERPVLGKYVMHCHNLIHEDHDMMTELDVRPGAGAVPAAAGRDMPPSMMVQWELRA
jgi:FtsP/CotA-like multicopper oxidase with cupredoxin domain